MAAKKPNILFIMGDDIGWFNISAYNLGIMSYRTPNIDRIAKEGALFTDWYGQQSCTAGRSAFITGQSGFRTGNLKVGLPGAPEGLQARDVTLAQLLKAQGYMTAQFGKNHLGDRDEHLPTAHEIGRASCRERVSHLGQGGTSGGFWRNSQPGVGCRSGNPPRRFGEGFSSIHPLPRRGFSKEDL